MALIKTYTDHSNMDLSVNMNVPEVLQSLNGYTQNTNKLTGKIIKYDNDVVDYKYDIDVKFKTINVNINNLCYAIKSKNPDLEYKYILFANWGEGLGAFISKDLNLSNALNSNNHLCSISFYSGNNRVAMFETEEYFGIGGQRDIQVGGTLYKPLTTALLHKDSINELLGEVEVLSYDTEFGGISDADGYNPNFDNSSDIIPVPNMPSVGVSNVGFVNVYKTSQGALQNLGADLFPDFVPPPTPEPSEDLATTIAMGFTNVVENLSNLLSSYINSNLINYIIDCHCLPVSPTVGENEQIKIGFKNFPQTAMRVTSDYVDFNCGTLNLKEYYGNFIDYVGTRASLYLPFIGFVPIKNEYFQSGALTVKYRFNIIDGSFMCYVLATSSKSNLKDTVIGTYSGNACVHIPITGVNYSNMVSGLVNGATSIASASKGVGGVAINTALSTLSMKPEMQGNNSYNATSSFLGIRYPYLLIEREVSNFSENYPNEYGLPLNVTKTINELTGYVEMDENIHIELNCMDEEKQMIKELLTGGIII